MMGDLFAGNEPYGWWLIAAILLASAEMLAPGVFLIWIAIAAAATGVFAATTPIDTAGQFILFAVLALISVYAGRSWYNAHPVDAEDDMLNDRVARLIGDTVRVVAPIVDGRGRVRVADSEWSARGPDAPVGAQVVIVGCDSGCLIVEPKIAPPTDQNLPAAR